MSRNVGGGGLVMAKELRMNRPRALLSATTSLAETQGAAIDRSGADVLLTARAECYHVGHSDPFPETVRRLRAYAAAGADVLFAPGPQTPAEIEALVAAGGAAAFDVVVVCGVGLGVGG